MGLRGLGYRVSQQVLWRYQLSEPRCALTIDDVPLLDKPSQLEALALQRPQRSKHPHPRSRVFVAESHQRSLCRARAGHMKRRTVAPASGNPRCAQEEQGPPFACEATP